MPVYEYEHTWEPCQLGKVFDWVQSINDAAFNYCPVCGQPVKRLISAAYINTPKTDTELRDLGFTKLVRRDDGVYENVTRRGNESRYMERGKKHTQPDVSKIVGD